MLERQPSGLLRFLLRLPRLLYRLQLGWLLGPRFLLLWHKGRVTGTWREAVLEVVQANHSERSYVVAAAWGDHSDWLRNLRADPHACVRVARHRFAARARELDPEAARQVLRSYIRDHRLAARGLALALGLPRPDRSDAWDALAASLPLVRLSRDNSAPNR